MFEIRKIANSIQYYKLDFNYLKKNGVSNLMFEIRILSDLKFFHSILRILTAILNMLILKFIFEIRI